MRGRRWAVIAALVAAGSCRGRDHRTGRRPWRPTRRRASRTRARSRARRARRVGAPAAAVWSLSIAWASSAGATPSRSVLRRPSGLAVLPMRMTCALPAFCGAGRAEVVERGLRRVGQLLAVGEQHRRAQRPAHQLRGGDRRAPVLGVDERDGGRARVARARGVDRLRHARGVGDRVRAAHAGGVLRGESGEAKALAAPSSSLPLPTTGWRCVAPRPCRPRRSRRRMRRARAGEGAAGRARPWTR